MKHTRSADVRHDESRVRTPAALVDKVLRSLAVGCAVNLVACGGAPAVQPSAGDPSSPAASATGAQPPAVAAPSAAQPNSGGAPAAGKPQQFMSDRRLKRNVQSIGPVLARLMNRG